MRITTAIVFLATFVGSLEAFAPLKNPPTTRTAGAAAEHRRQHVPACNTALFASPRSNTEAVRSAIASTIMTIVLLFSPPTTTIRQSLLHASTAWAAEQQQQQVVVVAPPAEAAVASTDLPAPPEALETPPLPNQEESALQVLQPTEQEETPPWAPYSPVDEVWTLVDKYYIDRTFGGQDWKAIKQKYKRLETPKDDLKAVTEMVKSLGDKYSRILDKKQYAAIQKFDLIGVGVTLMPDSHKKIIVGAPPVAGSASDRAGLQVGDAVVAVNGIPTEGKTAFDIIDQISQNPNAETVTMTIISQGPDDLMGEGIKRELTMERAFQQVNDPIRFKMAETRKDGTKVGFIRVLEFNSLVNSKLEEAFRTLAAEGANAYVIDLRGNPGGAFQSAVEISSLFVDNRVATYVVDSNGVEMPFRTATGRVVVDPKAPLAIWVDSGSASASEVLAGSLHDNCRAVVMGSQSYGKGLIQAVYGLKNGAGLVLTVARYVTPNGTEIQGTGIKPDIEGNVPLNIPGLSTDTSKVDFSDISKRLQPSMCQLPSQ